MKQRLYWLVTNRGLAKSETEARARIMAGEVTVDGQTVTKAAWAVPEEAVIELKPRSKYVSRGGAKLASVAARLGVSFEGKVVLDVGSSTGGFTDFALQNGARRVYAVDAGTAQLAYKLRVDPRVVSIEKTDIRDVSELPERIDLAVVDISFMTVTRILPFVANLVQEAPIVVMVKPQFEAPKAATNQTKGVVKDEGLRRRILKGFEVLVKDDYEIVSKADSKIAGTKGNVERFYVLKRIRPNTY